MLEAGLPDSDCHACSFACSPARQDHAGPVQQLKGRLHRAGYYAEGHRAAADRGARSKRPQARPPSRDTGPGPRGSVDHGVLSGSRPRARCPR